MTITDAERAERAHRMRVAAGTKDPATLPFSCRCGARWSGYETCHCGSCHITASGLATFDRHRPNGRCVPPASVGLVPIPGRAYECWGTTSNPTTTTEES